MKIGSHVSNSGESMLLGSAKEAISYGANCFMVYVGAPQTTFRKNVNEMNILAMQEMLNRNGIKLDDVIIHAPYIVNLAQPDAEKRDYAISFLANDIRIIDAIGAKYMVLHPGAHMKEGSERGIIRIAQGINKIINNTSSSKVVITLETMAGKGTECGITFEEIHKIIDLVDNKERIGVCLDTCHINDAGYDLVNNYEEVLTAFDRIIGFNYLKVIHVNDSKNILASHKDRHENIGFGNIGFETLHKLVTDERFTQIPKILETPYIEDPLNSNYSYPPYKQEIAMLKSGLFNEKLKEEIIFANHLVG